MAARWASLLIFSGRLDEVEGDGRLNADDLEEFGHWAAARSRMGRRCEDEDVDDLE